MIGRRGVLGGFFAMPSIAKEAINEGANMISGASLGTAVGSDNIGPSFLEQKFYRAQDILSARDAAKSTIERHMPYDIAEKKSWSRAFKAHVYAARAEREARRRSSSLYGAVSEAVMRRAVRAAGLDDD